MIITFHLLAWHALIRSPIHKSLTQDTFIHCLCFHEERDLEILEYLFGWSVSDSSLVFVQENQITGLHVCYQEYIIEERVSNSRMSLYEHSRESNVTRTWEIFVYFPYFLSYTMLSSAREDKNETERSVRFIFPSKCFSLLDSYV